MAHSRKSGRQKNADMVSSRALSGPTFRGLEYVVRAEPQLGEGAASCAETVICFQHERGAEGVRSGRADRPAWDLEHLPAFLVP